MNKYKRIGLTVKPRLTEKDETLQHVLSILNELQLDVFVDRKNVGDIACTKKFPDLKSADDIDLLLVIGGDGTIFRALRELQSFAVPILTVNKGSVGFLAEIGLQEVDALFPKLLGGEGVIEERRILSVEVVRNGEHIFQCFALNEAVISQGTISRLLDLKTTVADEPLATYHADGLIIATPTGSTAYSLAAGGPVVHPQLSALIITPINPHSFNQRPIVIPGTSVVDVQVAKCNDSFLESTVGLTLDGQIYHELQKDDHIIARIHDKTAKFIRRKEDTFFHTLRTKLKWAERLEK